MKLYYMAGACSLADHITLEWAGADYAAIKKERDELKSPDYLKINPRGVVPALVDDGYVVTENVAVLHYIAEKFPQAELAGTDMHSRAEVNHWLGFLNSDVHQSFKPLFGPGAYVSDESQHDDLKAHAGERLAKLFARFDERLKDNDWLGGAHRSIADPYLFVVLRWARAMKLDIKHMEGLNRFFERMLNDAGVKKALAAEGIG